MNNETVTLLNQPRRLHIPIEQLLSENNVTNQLVLSNTNIETVNNHLFSPLIQLPEQIYILSYYVVYFDLNSAHQHYLGNQHYYLYSMFKNNEHNIKIRIEEMCNYFSVVESKEQAYGVFDWIKLMENNRSIFMHNFNIEYFNLWPIVNFVNNYSHYTVPILIYLIGTISNTVLNNKRFIGVLGFFSNIGKASALSAASYSQSFKFNLSVTIVGWLAYIIGFAIYDINYKKLYTQNIKVFKDNTWYINKEYMHKWWPWHILFYFVIILGVMFSTSFFIIISNSLDSPAKLIGTTVASFLGSSLFISRWYSLLKRDYKLGGFEQWKMSFQRCFQESLCFNFLSLANFIVWNFWLQGTGIHQNVYAIVIGLSAYIILSMIQMYLEIKGGNPLLYGLVYSMIFTSLSFSSSGLYELFIANGSSSLKLTMLIITGLGILSLPMVVYRPEHNVNLWDVLRGKSTEVTIRDLGFDSTYQLILFYCFAIHTFILFSYFPYNK